MKFKRAYLVKPGLFEIREVEESPKGGEVLVKIAACGLCNWELNFWKGYLNFTGYPHPLGHEWAGTVVELGPGVKTLNVGDNVAALVNGFGGFGEYKAMADFVIEGTGRPSVLNAAQAYLKSSGRGKLALMSSHEEICEEFDFREAIKRGLQIIVPHPPFSVNQNDDFRRAINLLNQGTFKVTEVVSHEFTLQDINQAFETLENKPADFLKGIVTP